MVKYLVDTDVLIDFLKGKNGALVLIAKLGGLDATAISLITWAEVLEGLLDYPEKLKEVEALLLDVKVFDVDKKIAKLFILKRHVLRKAGNLIDNMDIFIASTALVNKLTLVTNNKRDFERIKGLKLYTD